MHVDKWSERNQILDTIVKQGISVDVRVGLGVFENPVLNGLEGIQWARRVVFVVFMPGLDVADFLQFSLNMIPCRFTQSNGFWVAFRGLK